MQITPFPIFTFCRYTFLYFTSSFIIMLFNVIFFCIFSAFFETCFQKGSLIIHFVRLVGWLGEVKNFLTRHRRELGFVLLASLLSIYRPIKCLKVLSLKFCLRFNFTLLKFEFFSTVIPFEYLLTVNFV